VRLVTVISSTIVLASCAMNNGPQGNLARLAPSVELTFDHFGKAIDLRDQRIAETGEPVGLREPGSDIWLRLRNNSEFLISFATFSMYVGPKTEPVTAADGRGLLALSEGMEVNVIFGIEDSTGRPVPYGGDVSSKSWLPSGRSIIFGVPRQLFSNDHSVFVEYNIDQPADVSKREARFRVYFRAKDLPGGPS
jgi:hypothetical protein